VTITTHLSSYQYRIHFFVLRSAEPITGPPWVLRKFRTPAEIAPCLGYPAFSAEVRSDVLQASRSSCIALVVRVCQHRWIRPYLHFTTLDVGPNVHSHLPLGSRDKPAELGFTQSSIRHTRLALTTHRIDDFLLRGRPRMLWSPSSFEGWGKRGVHGTFHQFQYHLVHSKSAADAAHCRTRSLSARSARPPQSRAASPALLACWYSLMIGAPHDNQTLF
jgi:hypothetical protein